VCRAYVCRNSAGARCAQTREQNRRGTCPRHRNAGACPIRPNESGSDKPPSEPLRRSMATASLIGLVQWDLEPTHIRPYTRGMGRAPTSRRIRTALHPDRYVGPELVLSGQVGDLEPELFVDGCRDAMRSGSRSLRSRRRGRTRVPSLVTAGDLASWAAASPGLVRSPGRVGRVPPRARRHRSALPGPVARQPADTVPHRA
jgi:hypothetical protein